MHKFSLLVLVEIRTQSRRQVEKSVSKIACPLVSGTKKVPKMRFFALCPTLKGTRIPFCSISANTLGSIC